LSFKSAGLRVSEQNPPPPAALQAMAELGHDLSGHLSMPLTPETVEEAALLVVMEEWQVKELADRYPQARGKVALLPEWASEPAWGRARYNIGDPFGQGIDTYRRCRDTIMDCLANLLRNANIGEEMKIAERAPAACPRSEASSGGPLVWIALLAAAAGLVFLPTLQALWQTWMTDSENSHGLLVPLITAWLIWSRRSELEKPEAPSYAGLALLVAGLLLYLGGTVGFVQLMASVGVVTSLAGLAWFNLGTRPFRRVAFAFGFLLFAIPVPISVTSLIAFPLQIFATKVSAAVVGMLSIPVYREGNMLYFTNTQLEVAEACSGIRSMMAFLMLGTLFAYLTRGTILRRLLLVALAIPLSVVMNIVRVSGTGILASIYGDSVAQGFLHEFSGLAVFAVGFALMAGLHVLLDRGGKREGQGEGSHA
jgi:exosortase